jgi:hypothetical protein
LAVTVGAVKAAVAAAVVGMTLASPVLISHAKAMYPAEVIDQSMVCCAAEVSRSSSALTVGAE